jgi:hypothetical protein
LSEEVFAKVERLFLLGLRASDPLLLLGPCQQALA